MRPYTVVVNKDLPAVAKTTQMSAKKEPCQNELTGLFQLVILKQELLAEHVLDQTNNNHKAATANC
jgi:hypothetical protein